MSKRTALVLFIMVAVSVGLFLKRPQVDVETEPSVSLASKVPIENTSVPSTVAAKTKEPLPSIGNESEFKNRYPGNWVLGKNEKGRVDYISGGTIPIDARVSGSVVGLINTLSEILDVPAAQLEKQAPNPTTKTDLSRVTEFKQNVDGLEVYQGQVTVHSRETDGAVFLINNGSKKVGDYNKVPRLSENDAKLILVTKYGSAIESLDLKRGPVIFVGDSGATELVWVFEVKLATPKFHGFESAVGAESGLVLSEIPTTVR